MKAIFIYPSALVLSIFTSGCGQQQTTNPTEVPSGMHLVTPVQKTTTSTKHSPAPTPTASQELSIEQTQYFSYALPPGWRLGEDGQFALTLVAADNKAYTVMVGNSGLMPEYEPSQFVYSKMMAMQPANLQLSQPTQGQPVSGFQQAYTYAISYQSNGRNYKGVATCHVAPYYGGSTMAMTAAVAESSQWPSYAGWLPKVSQQVAATNGAAFGMRGMMQQNLRTSMAYAQAAKEYRNWSQQKQQEVTDYRNDVQDRQQKEFRENLGAVSTYTNPFGGTAPVELSTQYKYYWMNNQGQVLGTDEAGINPNQGSSYEWRQMEAARQ